MKIIKSVLKYAVLPVLLLTLIMGSVWGYKYYICGVPSTTLEGKDYSEFVSNWADEAMQYAKVRNLNENYCVLVDYGIPSGTPRVYVWSFKKKKIVHSTYTMHGPGKGSTDKKPVFSNQAGSMCSTLGHFEITKHHGKRQKRGFRLNGLDIANRNAYNRGIMLHRGVWVDMHCWMQHIPLNKLCCQGCVTVSSRGFNYLEKLVKKEKTPILLWSIDSSK